MDIKEMARQACESPEKKFKRRGNSKDTYVTGHTKYLGFLLGYDNEPWVFSIASLLAEDWVEVDPVTLEEITMKTFILLTGTNPSDFSQHLSFYNKGDKRENNFEASITLEGIESKEQAEQIARDAIEKHYGYKSVILEWGPNFYDGQL